MTYHKAAVLGAIVADAAALGLHWIYDPARIDAIAAQHGTAAFTPLDPANFAGVPSYFAHGARKDGQCSQYGEALRLARPCIGPDGFDVTAYQTRFAAHFGPGGTYSGYIDRPTHGVLENLAAKVMAPSGIDDDQLPAIARLPAVVAFGRPQDTLPAIQVTNVNDVATHYGQIFAGLLRDVLGGGDLLGALNTAAQGAGDLTAALETAETDSTAYGEVTQRACHLPMAMPLAFHILKHSADYREAVERNIRAGGDSCGRAMIIGAVMGAAHGIEGQGVPLEWVLKCEAAGEVL
jgi:hypothetical protein